MNAFSKILLFAASLSALAVSAQETRQREIKLKTVVLDAGHGGKDAGATYGTIYEKDIALSVVLKLGAKIKSAYPDVNVVYTRSTDVFVPLADRGRIANKAKGDLFISVHCNASTSPAAEGSETFTLGLHKNEASLEVAKKENAVITLESNYEEEYGGFSPDDPESYIMFSMGQQGYVRESIEFSHIIQQNYKNNFKHTDRGIKQAGFLVLWRASMPSVLTELGFISNAADRAILVSADGQEKYAEALFAAFSEHKKNADKSFEYTYAPVEKPAEAVAVNTDGVPSGSHYTVQLISSSRKVEMNKKNFGDIAAEVIEVKDNKYYKYFVGLKKNHTEAASLNNKVREGKFKDAFVVGFHDGKIIKASELKKILKN